MTHKERFYAAVNYTKPDRLPTKYYNTNELDRKLMKFFNSESTNELLTILGDDFRSVYPCYIGPEKKILTMAVGKVYGENAILAIHSEPEHMMNLCFCLIKM